MNEQAKQLLLEYLHWANTRKFYAQPPQKNVLSQFMPSKHHDAPDAPLSPLVAAFHFALIGTEERAREAFLAVYDTRYRKWPIKRVAHEYKLSRSTCYRLAHDTAEELVRRAKRTVAEYESNYLGNSRGF